uniref:C2H2-type domain-containing protein n=1 Tax=Oryzias latipes TaxID=8090 RepID=A0A3P9KJN2_ORYLA
KHLCPVCGRDCFKSFKQRSVLKSHLLTHSGVRYQCPLCSRSFSRALELTYHVDVHSEARPYFCSICNLDLSGPGTGPRWVLRFCRAVKFCWGGGGNRSCSQKVCLEGESWSWLQVS